MLKRQIRTNRTKQIELMASKCGYLCLKNKYAPHNLINKID